MLCILAGVTARGYTTLLKEAVVVDDIACTNPAELSRKLQTFPAEACTETTHPRCIVGLDGLSGGEKALIALSIYFAIMRVDAPPFCFLDEVDTALDDINVDRFADYMKKSGFATQFICVTHRRGTMEAADMLYGVTMQEKGVTKLLELNVAELEKTLLSQGA